MDTGLALSLVNWDLYNQFCEEVKYACDYLSSTYRLWLPPWMGVYACDYLSVGVTFAAYCCEVKSNLD